MWFVSDYVWLLSNSSTQKNIPGMLLWSVTICRTKRPTAKTIFSQKMFSSIYEVVWSNENLVNKTLNEQTPPYPWIPPPVSLLPDSPRASYSLPLAGSHDILFIPHLRHWTRCVLITLFPSVSLTIYIIVPRGQGPVLPPLNVLST